MPDWEVVVVVDPEDDIAGIAALAEPHRRDLYRLVASSRAPVGKDEAAAALGLARSVATFHLDRLVADGLLVTEYKRRSGRVGPGAGRPAKLYRRADREITVSLPTRRYRLAADLLAAAVSTALSSSEPLDAVLARVARERGNQLGEAVRQGVGGRARRRTVVAAALEALDREGYEPRPDGHEIVLANCPFHGLVDDHRELVCSMNHDLLSGLGDALPRGTLSARLEPSDDNCCVRLRTREKLS